MNDQPGPRPKPPERPWYERTSAPLRADEVDDYDRKVPGRVKKSGSIFGNIEG